MTVILISGDQDGVGKTTLARKLSRDVYSFADEVRRELQEQYPHIPWFDKSPSAKSLYYPELGMTLREKLRQWGSYRREQDSAYWARRLVDKLMIVAPDHFAVDDVRYLNEVDVMQRFFVNRVVHIHVVDEIVWFDSHENAQLRQTADYRVEVNFG